MEFKYKTWEDVKALTLEGYNEYRDLSMTDHHIFLALTALSLVGEEFSAAALASVYGGWPMESELVQNYFALGNVVGTDLWKTERSNFTQGKPNNFFWTNRW